MMEVEDRDSRTVRCCSRPLVLCRGCRQCRCHSTSSSSCTLVDTSYSHPTHSRSRQIPTLRLTELLKFSACLLTVIRWPLAMAAPSSPIPDEKRIPIPDDHPRLWVNPCGFYSDEQNATPVHEMVLTYEDILKAIIVQSAVARDSVESFKNEYVMATFQCDFETHHQSFKSMQYNWYKKVPKSLGIATDIEHLATLQLNQFLKDAYHLLQIMAVALEQVAWDMEQDRSKFYRHFQDVEFKLRTVLCELQWALIERKEEPDADPDRSVMDEEFRNMKSDTDRHLRDWLIFRDYMIVLEYVRDVLQYFLDKPERISPS